MVSEKEEFFIGQIIKLKRKIYIEDEHLDEKVMCLLDKHLKEELCEEGIEKWFNLIPFFSLEEWKILLNRKVPISISSVYEVKHHISLNLENSKKIKNKEVKNLWLEKSAYLFKNKFENYNEVLELLSKIPKNAKFNRVIIENSLTYNDIFTLKELEEEVYKLLKNKSFLKIFFF